MILSDVLSSIWFRLSVILGLLSVLMLDVFFVHRIPSGTKWKVYRYQACFALAVIFLIPSNYIWKCLVSDVVPLSKGNFLATIWKLVVFSFLGMTHCANFTNFYGDMEPTAFQMTCWVCYGSWIILLTFLLPVRFMAWMFNKTWPSCNIRSFSKTKQALLSVVLTAMISCAAIISALEPPHIKSVTIPVKKFPHSLNGLRIALLSDIHIGPSVGKSTVDKVVKVANSIHPDIVVVVGDLVDGEVEALWKAALPLTHLQAKYGKYFVTGNHEYYTGDVENWLTFLGNSGFKVLHNSNVKIYDKDNPDSWFCLLGTDDVEADKVSYEGHGMNLTAAYAGCDVIHASVLLAHQPYAAKLAVQSNFDINLVLSGHTHHGQLYPLMPAIYLTNPYFGGLYEVANSNRVYVTAGTVYFGMPMRWGSRGEVTNITLVTAS